MKRTGSIVSRTNTIVNQGQGRRLATVGVLVSVECSNPDRLLGSYARSVASENHVRRITREGNVQTFPGETPGLVWHQATYRLH